ncbi:sigma-70 family RNA polymerase sigma factor [Sporosarcina highlanderae]|uniref:Sigma-70 family RNA polymerase sigma factor n=1 Tax=Sporosarcina highlanderae TaxID=3035916 RepID=A0ABT8JNJ3_9BACL|nr:sigma-70 family RNA polymerase sigma factor [Sporosarcina highlanderae]MDN4606729.1 sigma-70 family RNA polymerase sigma factor [Sporosarcina highlanderae]
MVQKHERDQLLLTAIDSYGDYLLRLIYAIIKDEKKAEDIVQEVFIRYYLNLEKFEGRSSVKTYLYRIAVNECHNYFKSWAYRKMEISNLFGHLLVNKDTPEKKILQKESDDHIVKMIEGLPLKYREVIWLHYYSELTVTEIGSVLNCPVNTVKTRLARGREMARIALEEGNDYA